jgi:hypothetical protein
LPRRLFFHIAEIGGTGDHDIFNRLAKHLLCIANDFSQDQSGHVLRAIVPFAKGAHPISIAHVAFYCLCDQTWMNLSDVFCNLTNDNVVFRLEIDDRRSGESVLGVGNNGGPAMLIDVRDARVGCAKINPEHWFRLHH